MRPQLEWWEQKHCIMIRLGSAEMSCESLQVSAKLAESEGNAAEEQKPKRRDKTFKMALKHFRWSGQEDAKFFRANGKQALKEAEQRPVKLPDRIVVYPEPSAETEADKFAKINSLA